MILAFIGCTLAMTAQESIHVNYKGSKPTISDFVTAFVSSRDNDDEEDCTDEAFNALGFAWEHRRTGEPLTEGQTLTVDERNGYVSYVNRSEYEGTEDVVRIEMCYWNESDQRHKLIAYNVTCFRNGRHDPGQFDGLSFYRYDSNTKTMDRIEAPGFEVRYGTEDGAWVSYDLPRTGKNITETYWYQNSTKTKQKALTWNGKRFY